MTRVLLAGELAYNPERVLLLEEHGIELVGGLWIDDPLPFMTVGPLPFAPHVPGVTLSTWRDVRPDVVYAGLNWRCIPLVHELLGHADLPPVVLHFKEAPQRCLARGDWKSFAVVHERVAVRVYASAAEAAHVEALLPGRANPARTHVLDGDLPTAARFAGPSAPRLEDGPHTVLVGRPYGMDAAWLEGVTGAGIHVHVHGSEPPPWPTGNPRLHSHGPVAPQDWVRVLSRYDASWLHPHRSTNGGNLARAGWDDCNLPARIATSFAAGLPLIADANPGHRVEVQDLIARSGAGVLHEGPEHLAAWLRSRALETARAAVGAERGRWCFDAHAGRLAGVLRGAAAQP